MYTAKDKVFSKLKILSASNPVTTKDLASSLGLSRSVVSHYLNDLADNQKIQKIKGRPVRWTLSQTKQNNDVFLNFIGSQGSLKAIIDQATAAVAYPPNGLNILITGNSGVGKSYLAGKIVDFAKKENFIAKEAPFVTLNCADYANNPELVSSMLFGYIKGAYTGADESRDGLLAEANNGYLFLDEVHRLSSENQEKLFSFIDTGKFYRMGDNVHPIKSKVRLIMATTEDPKQALLTTFLRRIPVRLKLPDYAQRPLDERLALLQLLFYQEASSIDKEIEVDKYVVSSLLKINNPGNIGYLKNIIKVSCASAYKKQRQNKKIFLRIDDLLIPKLPEFEDFGLLRINPKRVLVYSSQNEINKYFVRLNELFGKLAEHFSENMLEQIRIAVSNFTKQRFNQASPNSLHFIHQRMYKTIIERQFGLRKTRYLENDLFCLYENHFELKNDLLKKVRHVLTQKISRAYHVSSYFYQKLFKFDSRNHESLIAVLSIMLSNHIDENIKLRGLMVAHGKDTATSIQSVVNSLCGTYIFDAINMPIDAGVDSIIKEANKLIDSFNTTNGFVLMVDMGSLSQLYSSLKNHLDGDVLVVNNLTTLTALDLALKMQANFPFKQIAKNADKEYKIGVQYYEGFSQSTNILVSCLSGMGISEKIRDIIQPILPTKIKVIPLDYEVLKEKIQNKEWNYFNNTLFVLTTIDLPNNVKFKSMNLYNLLDASGEDQLRKWLLPFMTDKQIDAFFQQILHFFSREGISERLSFLNPDVVIKEVETINSEYENFYHLKLDGKVKLNLYLHIALMIERLMIHRSTSIKVKPKGEKEIQFFRITRSIFQPIELKYNIRLTSYEISLLYELFKQFL